MCWYWGAVQGLVWAVQGLVRPAAHVVLVGLDSAGKTTVLLRLRYGHYVNAVPTAGFNTERVSAGGCRWVVWDVGGAERVRPLWRSYTRATDALIFVVDASASEERVEEARLEVAKVCRQAASSSLALHRPRPPILVLANKQDLPAARDPAHLAKALGLPDLPDAQPWAVAPACAVTGEGLDEAMTTLRTLVDKQRQ